jgi:hypothetical protein
MNWTPYPNTEGEWAELGDLILAAFPNGSWSVHNRRGGGSHTSFMAPVLGPFDLEGAKRKAEETAHIMNQRWE